MLRALDVEIDIKVRERRSKYTERNPKVCRVGQHHGEHDFGLTAAYKMADTCATLLTSGT